MGGYDALRGSTEGCAIVNNTLFRNDSLRLGSGELMLQYDTRDNTITNNIFYASGQGYLITNAFTENSGNVLDGNIYYSPIGAADAEWQWKGAYHQGFAAWQAADGQDALSQFANPRLVSTTIPDLHLRGTSPARESGLFHDEAITGGKDIDGNPRVQGTIDVGADEAE
jgi:hypothetical protein